MVFMSESERCRCIRWLMNAHKTVSTDLALDYILNDLLIANNRRQLFDSYVSALHEVLFACVSDTDCVNYIIQEANLVEPFNRCFKTKYKIKYPTRP